MKILIGFDGSRASREALEDLGRAGLPGKAHVFILSAIGPLVPFEYLGSDISGTSMYSALLMDSANLVIDLEKEAKEVASEGGRILRNALPGCSVAYGTSVDLPAQAILAKAEAWKPDLIVVGSRGWTAIGGMLLGGVADKVVRHARCDVRIGRKNRAKGKAAPRILIGYDGSAHAEAAVSTVGRRSWPKGTSVTILACVPTQFPIGSIGKAVRENLARKTAGEDPWSWLERALGKAASRLGKRGLKVTPMLKVADPRRALSNEANRTGIDCIFLGSRGLSGLKRFLIGGVSATVAAHAKCSVEIIHGPAKRSGTLGGGRLPVNASEGQSIPEG